MPTRFVAAPLVLAVVLMVPVSGCVNFDWDASRFSGKTDAGSGDGSDTGPDQDSGDGCRRLSIAIASDKDDGSVAGVRDGVNSAEHNPQGSDPDGVVLFKGIYVGNWNTGLAFGYFRFELPQAIPTDWSFSNAFLRFHGVGEIGDDVAKPASRELRILLEDSADAPVVPLNAMNALAETPLPRGTREIIDQQAWSVTDWNDTAPNDANDSPELSRLLNNLLDEHGPLSAGAHVQFWIVGSPTSGNAEFGMHDVTGTGEPTRLFLDVGPPGACD